MTNLSPSERPNLFSYATSELSQDAFICWLAKWADPKYKSADAKLHEAARQFVGSMVRKCKSDFEPASIKTVNIRRQVGKLDVLIEINKAPETVEKSLGELAILVEDKTHTFNHGTQLDDYYNYVKGLGYVPSQMIPLYFKTGYQSRFDTLGAFKPYVRRDFLDVLRQGKANRVDNAIFSDFLAHLEGIEAAIQQFDKKPLYKDEDKKESGWNGNDWQGLFLVLYETFGKDDNKTDWGYVPNASGGFFGFWWDFEGDTTGDYWSYLQWENDKLCYKIGFSDKAYSAEGWKNQAYEVKSVWTGILLTLDPGLNSMNAKIGKTMTVAKRDTALSSKADGTLDMERVIATMTNAQDVLKEARQKLVKLSD